MFPNKFFDKRKTWVSQVMEIATLHNLSMDPLTELDIASPTDLDIASPTDLDIASPTDLDIASPTDLDIASLTELDIASLTDLDTDIAWVASMEYLILPPLFSFFFLTYEGFPKRRAIH